MMYDEWQSVAMIMMLTVLREMVNENENFKKKKTGIYPH